MTILPRKTGLERVYKETNFVPVKKSRKDFQNTVSYAAAYLAVPLGIEKVRAPYPILGIGRYSFFLDRPPLLALSPEEVLASFAYVLGHEVTHLLHWKINPGNFREAYREARNLREAVGHYGGVIFSKDDHSPIESLRMRIIEEMVDRNLLESRSPKNSSPMERVNYYETHEGGRRLAEYMLDNEIGDEGFAQLARTNVKGAKNLMKKWGYKGELFVPVEDF